MRAISVFSGCGGCSLGLRQAGFDIRLAVDIDEDACDTYAANLGRKAVWCADLAQIRPYQLLEHSELKHEEVDLIVGGPPCQGFSSAGAKDWADARNVLLRNFVEIITTLKPTWFIMENVEGLLTANDGIFLIEAITRFLETGYWVRAKKVYMEQHGLPQRRKRVLVVGNLEARDFNFPQPLHFEYPALPTIDYHPQLSVLDAIGDLPFSTDTGEVYYQQEPQCEFQQRLRRTDNGVILHHQTKKLNDSVQQRINLLRQGETMKHLPAHLQHPSFARRSYRRVMDGTPTEKRGGASYGFGSQMAGDTGSASMQQNRTE
jgi:DNA (cytosine-5)-methyltransferase 1